jgi:hypothetical protein
MTARTTTVIASSPLTDPPLVARRASGAPVRSALAVALEALLVLAALAARRMIVAVLDAHVSAARS